MRGLLKAALLLAPALASASIVTVPPVEGHEEWDGKVDGPIAGHSFALINLDVPSESRSPDNWASQSLDFRLDVLPSEEVCGFGNITIDGQVLPQTLDGEILNGKGSISMDRKSIVVAAWSFHCIKVNGQPDAQLLKFIIDFVDGKAMEDVGFAVLFRQTGTTEIVHIETDLSIPDYVVANPNPDGLLPLGEHIDFPHYDIEDDIAELDFMWAQLQELQYLIAQKERAIAEQYSQNFEEEIKDCDSLRCVVRTVADKARNVAHKLYEKIRGDHEEYDEDIDGFPKPPFKKPHGFPKNPFKHLPKPGKGKHGKPGNHTCGPPKHGKGNHTHPPPHWRKPHFPHRPLPICRYPPPPHHRPPHHGPPHHGPSPPGPPPPGPPPHGPPHGKPPGGPPDMHGGPLDFPPPPFDDAEGPKYPPPPQHPDSPPPPALFEDDQGPPGSPPGNRHRPPQFDDFGRPRHNGIGKAFHIIKFVVIGFLFAFLIIALHRRTCNPKSRASRQARREERHRRRAYRRAARKHTVLRFFTRFSGNDSDDSDDYEEKRARLLADAEDGISTAMAEEIASLRNAAGVVGDLVAAEEDRTQVPTQPPAQTQPIPIARSEETPLMRDFEIGSQIGDGEELPAYEDNDGSEDSSVIADGFRYTPGSTEYSPSHSASGSVSDILGPDTKQ